jgi:hypothetical protein
MFVKKYYSRYKKMDSAKQKIKDDTILGRIENILKFPFIYESTRQFLTSVYEQYNKNGNLTETQLKSVKKIEEKYSLETVVAYEDWKKRYNEEKRNTAKICAHYYKANPPYFAELGRKILQNLDFVPTEKQYRSMCENNFAKKVIRETLSEPKFEVGQLVKGRKNAPLSIADRFFSVIEIGVAPVTSAAKGAKKYTLLPLGNTKIVECEERFLKKTKK